MDSDADTPPRRSAFSDVPVNVSARPRHRNTSGNTPSSRPCAQALRYLLCSHLFPCCCFRRGTQTVSFTGSRSRACSWHVHAPPAPCLQIQVPACTAFLSLPYPTLHSTARLGTAQTVRRRALDDAAVAEAAEPAYNKGVTGFAERPKLVMLRALLLRLWDSFELPPNPLDGDPKSLTLPSQEQHMPAQIAHWPPLALCSARSWCCCARCCGSPVSSSVVSGW